MGVADSTGKLQDDKKLECIVRSKIQLPSEKACLGYTQHPIKFI